MRISEIYGGGRPVFSFEFFPPKTAEGAGKLLTTVADLKDALAPDFVSVTCGAGGSTRERTLECVTSIQGSLEITAMAHLTCADTSTDDIRENMQLLLANGVENLLALRGDPPADGRPADPVPDGFGYASELVEFLEDNYDVDIGGACYPEGHIESADPATDLRWTRHKVECGARFLITQLFFDNAHYFGFVERARAAGIDVPIVPGIMPITNRAQVERFTAMCGATVPEELAQRLEGCGDDAAKCMATGIEHAILQCRALLEGGAPGVHFYTLNKSHATRSVLAAV
ncbi:MAG: methylenetetrahydrofolate reductase [NAD(P)H] [Planctomycetota bacterium]|nr:methylenetetrahydrofolate reductase [NAD(P)H] [Planctomycetota bacterium]MDP6763201.1 methylenetetrahydrofolate reductase [NAD(P)H] [Planctomycetota bacterium]MDP6990590.1 methylenetetrahydrofolate reductase [NAD(P)H] [Planctomycetota bacterium]